MFISHLLSSFVSSYPLYDCLFELLLVNIDMLTLFSQFFTWCNDTMFLQALTHMLELLKMNYKACRLVLQIVVEAARGLLFSGGECDSFSKLATPSTMRSCSPSLC
ncbi:hypothetical protein ACOSP7_001798 [Xanthoceras sorbifolium]